MFSGQLSFLFPKLKDLLIQDGMTENNLDELLTNIIFIEKEMPKRIKPTHFPGMKTTERFWNFFQVFCFSLYLVLHFRRVNHVCGQYISDEEAGRLTELALLHYPSDPRGQKDIDLYFSTLKYNNNRNTLDIEQMRAEQRKLQDEVPESLRLAFLHHVDDAHQLGVEVNKLQFSSEEYIQLLSATTKWQMLEQQIYEYQHPDEVESPLYNEIFVKTINSRPVNMEGVEEHHRQDDTTGEQEEPMVLCMECFEASQPASQLLARGICPTDDEPRMVWRHRQRLPAFLRRYLARIQAIFLRLRLHPMGQ